MTVDRKREQMSTVNWMEHVFLKKENDTDKVFVEIIIIDVRDVLLFVAVFRYSGLSNQM